MSLSYVFTPKMTTARILVTPVPPNPRLYIIQTLPRHPCPFGLNLTSAQLLIAFPVSLVLAI